MAHFQAFAAGRGGVSVAAAQIDGTTVDNIVVASGPGIPGEVKVYRSALPSAAGAAPPLFSTFKPYGDDRSGVSIATGFVDFSTGRDSIVTAPGAGSPAEVKVFAFPLLKPIGPAAPGAGIEQPVTTDSFLPFGNDYRGGVSLATGWLAGTLGGAKRIVVSQLAGNGAVKIFSSGSALDGGPSLYLQSPMHHGHGAQFREIADFKPFEGSAGTRVATTSTTKGAHLLISGVEAGGANGSVVKYDLVRPAAEATTLQAVRLGQVWTGKASQPAFLGGD
jgi:hypothetical protein